MNYVPSPTGIAFMRSKAFVKLIVGPVGGGKSTVALMDLWTMAIEQEPFKNIRRTKFILLRNTLAQLKSTVKPLIDQWFVTLPERPLGEWRLSENVFEIKARLDDGTILHSEFCLMAADTAEDVRRLLSLEASAAWVEEAREVAPEVFEGLQGRVNRFPNRQAGGVTRPCVICSTNPPPVGTFWHDIISQPSAKTDIFIQPPAMLDDGALNPDAENLVNLAPDYYENLADGKSDDWLGVYLKNKFGAGGLGQPVFKSTFRRDFHVATTSLELISSTMKQVIVGSDNGLTAGAVIAQEDARGAIRLLREAYVPQGETMGYDRFLDSILIPQLRDLGVPSKNVLFVVDPACYQRGQANEVTIAQEITKRGFMVRRANSNSPERRVSAVEGLLLRQIDGKALLRIDPSMTHLIAALEWGYRNKKRATAAGDASVDKNFWSHIAEALQYLALYYNDPGAAEGNRNGLREVQKRSFAYT